MSFQEGDHVYALFEGTGKYYPATIQGRGRNRNSYTVTFSNGEVMTLRNSQIKRESAMRGASKSPSRKSGASRSRSRSRSRGRSPGRPRARSKSPVQRKRSTNKSSTPDRATTASSSSSSSTSRTSRRSTTTTTTTTATITKVTEPKPNHNVTPPRQSARIAAQLDEKPKPTTTTNTSSTRTNVGRKTSGACCQWNERARLVGILVCALSTPALLLAVLNHCTSKKNCVLFKLPSIPRTVNALFDVKVLYCMMGMMALQSILAVLPIGKLVDGVSANGGRKLKYRLNGLVALLVTTSLFCLIAFYLKYNVTFVYDNANKFVALIMVKTFLFSLLFYIKSRRASRGQLNPEASSGNILRDWFYGRELNPRLGPIDPKFVHVGRALYVCVTLHNASALAKACTTTHAAPSATLLVATVLQFLQALDALWFEEEVLYGWDMRHSGFGHLILQTYGPFRLVLWTIPVRFILSQEVALSKSVLSAICFLWAAGYVIHRGATSQKFKFRKNPYDPALSHLSSIPAGNNRRLLVSGWWGLVRHPNYLGEIIMGTALAMTCGFTHFFPYLYPLYLMIVLVARTLRTETYCKRSYGSAWDNYSSRVSHRLFPHIW